MSNRLKELREAKSMSFRKLSEDLKKHNISISPDALAKYERGDRKPKIDKWQSLAVYFGVPVSYLQGKSKSLNESGYSKNYIFQCLLDGYNEDWYFNLRYVFTRGYNVGTKEDEATISLKEVIDEYLTKEKIKKPKKLTLDFIKNNFDFIFQDNNIKRLLTTKDSYSDDEIKENLTTTISMRNLTNN